MSDLMPVWRDRGALMHRKRVLRLLIAAIALETIGCAGTRPLVGPWAARDVVVPDASAPAGGDPAAAGPGEIVARPSAQAATGHRAGRPEKRYPWPRRVWQRGLYLGKEGSREAGSAARRTVVDAAVVAWRALEITEQVVAPFLPDDD